MKAADGPLTESLFYKVSVTDANGREIFEESGISHSYTEAWNKIINVQARGSSNTIKDVGGVDRTVSQSSSNLRANAGIGNANYGIRVGKGTTPVDISDYCLEIPVEQGTGPDQLSHQEVQNTAPVEAAPDCSFTIFRVFFNDTGATISGIQEIGCYVYMSGYYGLGFRDVLASPASIPYGGAMTVTYTLKVTA